MRRPLVLLLLLIGIAWLLRLEQLAAVSAAQAGQPICGNGLLEQGETPETCCADAGCPENKTCIANQCVWIAICGNGICEPTETAASCAADCAALALRPSAAPAAVLALTIGIAISLFLFRRLSALLPKRPRLRPHATPERWF